jgi:hypothetical protein
VARPQDRNRADDDAGAGDYVLLAWLVTSLTWDRGPVVGSGVRESEVCGLAVRGPDGLSDLMLDSLTRGRVELRVCDISQQREGRT